MTSDHDLRTSNKPVPQSIRKQWERLAQDISEHDRLYYQEDRSTVSNAHYDDLRDQIKTLERAYPNLVRVGTPSASVGYAPDQRFQAVFHQDSFEPAT